MSLRIVPITLKEANEYVANFHRHNKPTAGGKFALARTERFRFGAGGRCPA